MDRLNKSMEQCYQELEDLTQKQEAIQLSYEKSLAALQDADSSTETESL
jgi:exonuclease VII small subunit